MRSVFLVCFYIVCLGVYASKPTITIGYCPPALHFGAKDHYLFTDEGWVTCYYDGGAKKCEPYAESATPRHRRYLIHKGYHVASLPKRNRWLPSGTYCASKNLKDCPLFIMPIQVSSEAHHLRTCHFSRH